MERTVKILLIIIALILVIPISLFLIFSYFMVSDVYVEHRQDYTIDESQRIAEEYIKALYPYQKLGGGVLVLGGRQTLDCNSCYSFTYRFEIDSQSSPGNREIATVDVIVEGGLVLDVVYSESMIISNVYCRPEQRGAEACIDIYSPVCGSNGKTYPNSCNACADESVIYYSQGECA